VSDFPAAAFGAALPWAVLAEVIVLAATFAVAKLAGKHSVIDSAWGVLFVAVAVVAFVLSSGDGNRQRRLLLLTLPVLWGLRLAVHIGRRTLGKDEDPRYAQLVGKARGNPDLYALRAVYLLQGTVAFLIAMPILVGAFEPAGIGAVAWLGVAVWCVGVFFEAVGDSQLERFRRNRPTGAAVMDRVLWRYTRHPNYFGDACVWWGIYLVAADAWPGMLTFLAPVVMTLLLTVGSGTRLLERHMAGRAGWEDYAARTSMFVPLPPKRR
jgi:steroid 5-alpha reductase family enzyme